MNHIICRSRSIAKQYRMDTSHTPKWFTTMSWCWWKCEDDFGPYSLVPFPFSRHHLTTSPWTNIVINWSIRTFDLEDLEPFSASLTYLCVISSNFLGISLSDFISIVIYIIYMNRYVEIWFLIGIYVKFCACVRLELSIDHTSIRFRCEAITYCVPIIRLLLLLLLAVVDSSRECVVTSHISDVLKSVLMSFLE